MLLNRRIVRAGGSTTLVSWVIIWSILIFKKSLANRIQPATFSPKFPTSRRYDRFIQKIYDNSDTNHDGTITIDEAYNLVLRFYIQVNRHAPIDPPTRPQVHRLFHISDKNRNQRISRDEFTQLANLLAKRALVRILTAKSIVMLAAPLLAEYLLRLLANETWLPAMAKNVLPVPWHSKLVTRQFGRTVLIVTILAILGNSIMNLVNVLLDLSLPSP